MIQSAENIKNYRIVVLHMEKRPACYVYAPGQYVGYVRQIARSSIGVTIPISIRRSLKLRPGMEVMV